jgi:hypothetical protein
MADRDILGTQVLDEIETEQNMKKQQELPKETVPVAEDEWRTILLKDIEMIENCQDLLAKAKARKHPSLEHDEYMELRTRYRQAHLPNLAPPSGLFMGHILRITNMTNIALDNYLQQCGIALIPQLPPEPVHTYDIKRPAKGMNRVNIVEKKIKLARKLSEIHQDDINKNQPK